MQSLLAKSNVVFVTALSILLLTSSAFVCSWLGVRNVPEETPIGRQAEVAWSLAHGGGLQAPEFFSLIEDIKKQSENSQSKLLQDVIALGPHGEFYPKHPYFSSVLVVPLLWVFGQAGFLVFQLMMGVILLLSTYLVARRYCEEDPGVLAIALAFVGTQLLYGMDTFLFSYDLHAAAVLMLSLAMLPRRPFLAGLLLGSLVHFRASNIILVPFCLWFSRDNMPLARRYILGCGIMLVLFGVSNWVLYGGPFTLSYHRVPIVAPHGQLLQYPHESGFNVQVFVSDWFEKLCSFPKGWFLTNPAMLLAVLLPLLRARSERSFHLYVLIAGAITYSLFIFSYEYWGATYIGNRFLLPATFLLLVPAIVVGTELRSTYGLRTPQVE